MTINIHFKGCLITQITRKSLEVEISKAIEQSPKKINILFATTGGQINEGLLFYKFASGLEYPINIFNIGEIRSAGTVMFLAFKNRYFLPNSKFLFHSVRLKEGAVITDEKEKEKQIFNKEMLSIYKERLNLPKEYYEIMENSEEDINVENPILISQYFIASYSEETFNKPFIEITC